MAHDYPWLEPGDYDPEQTVEQRIPHPEGFHRKEAPEESFAAWLHGLPLKPAGAPITLHDGTVQSGLNTYIAVVDIDVLRFQECADTVIRLWAEYLWASGRKNEISFKFTSGDVCSWKKWRDGWYPHIEESGCPARTDLLVGENQEKDLWEGRSG